VHNRVTSKAAPKIAIVIPACDEEACISPVLNELLQTVDPEKFVIVIGVNGSFDRTAEIARRFPVLVAETSERGYGQGCRAAIDLVNDLVPQVRSYIFFAADGANDPRDIVRIESIYEQGYPFILGTRTTRVSNWRTMRLSHVIANFGLGLWCGLLTGRRFTDLGPLRLIDRELFESLGLQEMTFGWTIEAQIGTARLGAASCEIPVAERQRLAGRQKVSGVTWRQTFLIGCRIVAAGCRARLRYNKIAMRNVPRPFRRLLPQQ